MVPFSGWFKTCGELRMELLSYIVQFENSNLMVSYELWFMIPKVQLSSSHLWYLMVTMVTSCTLNSLVSLVNMIHDYNLLQLSFISWTCLNLSPCRMAGFDSCKKSAKMTVSAHLFDWDSIWRLQLVVGTCTSFLAQSICQPTSGSCRYGWTTVVSFLRWPQSCRQTWSWLYIYIYIYTYIYIYSYR